MLQLISAAHDDPGVRVPLTGSFAQKFNCQRELIPVAQFAISMAYFVLKRLCDMANLVCSYLGITPRTEANEEVSLPSQACPVDSNETEDTCLSRPAETHRHHNHQDGMLDKSSGPSTGQTGQCPSKQGGTDPADVGDIRKDVTGESLDARFLRPVQQTTSQTDRDPELDDGGCQASNLVDRSVQTDSHTRQEEEDVDTLASLPKDWCRWPVCAVHRLGGQCPLGEANCPDAHVGWEFASQIDAHGLVRICFESLGVANKFCARPQGCCRFFHPPEHIRMGLIRRRQAAIAASILKRREPTPNCPSGSVEEPINMDQPWPCTTTSCEQCAKGADHQNPAKSFRPLPWLINYGELLQECASAVSQPPDENSEKSTVVFNQKLALYLALAEALRERLIIAVREASSR
ncbi:unnamed protein product [Mesocestoides corti]|uniref:C3H1-type domain-containing protein n=1 Tax=Mesocestoides corti TaxID=53468 RepID=A0A0R3U2B9_MESCO|nr:unnamed protein product [Mesocestoides corti]